MAVNPMQRKANNSFLLGMLITLLITGIIIAFLILQLSKLNKEKEELIANRVNAYVLNAEVESGQIITSDMLKKLEIDALTIPDNAITSIGDFDSYSLCDSEGRTIITEANGGYTLMVSNTETAKLLLDNTMGKYYYEKNGTRQYITMDQTVVIAKVDLKANTILTTDLISRGELLTDDVRTQEYNVINLPSQLGNGEYIDIRLRLPNGQDYIVVSHKQVTIPNIAGVDSSDCIWMNMSELETLTMSGAIIEAYKAEGARLYATRYVEAGLQQAATATYVPSDTTIALIESDSNVVTEAKNALYARMNSKVEKLNTTVKDVVRNPINGATNGEDAMDRVIDGVQEEVQGLQEEREKYLESLGGY